MYQEINNIDSPNFTPRDSVRSIFGHSRNISSITIHHWGDPAAGASFAGVVNWLCNPTSGASAHAVIEADKVAWIVNGFDAAWHAGNAIGNATSIGLELNPRASEGDYDTAAECIASIRHLYGDLKLVPHNSWKATACPGVWNLSKLDKLARGWSSFNRYGGTVPYTSGSRPSGSQGHAGAVYTVRRGDTLSSIAAAHGTTWQTLAKINGLQNPNIISVGATIKITPF